MGSWQKARGRGCNAGEVCARRLLFFQVALWKSTGFVHAVCMRGDDWQIFGVQDARPGFLERQSTVSSFTFQVLFQEWCSNLSFENPNPNPILSQRHRRYTWYTRCVLWEVTMYAHLPFKKLSFLAVQLWPIFPLKYSLTRTLLQLELRWSKPDESHSEKSETETRKTVFSSSKTPKSHGDDGLAAAGCPVSNPDNNCANGLFSRFVNPHKFGLQVCKSHKTSPYKPH